MSTGVSQPNSFTGALSAPPPVLSSALSRQCQDPREIKLVCDLFINGAHHLYPPPSPFFLFELVSLTKTKPKDRSAKTKYIETIRRALDEYATVFLFSYDNMRSTLFKDIRMDWRESRLIRSPSSSVCHPHFLISLSLSLLCLCLPISQNCFREKLCDSNRSRKNS
jgi:hypothetical protein